MGECRGADLQLHRDRVRVAHVHVQLQLLQQQRAEVRLGEGEEPGGSSGYGLWCDELILTELLTSSPQRHSDHSHRQLSDQSPGRVRHLLGLRVHVSSPGHPHKGPGSGR